MGNKKAIASAHPATHIQGNIYIVFHRQSNCRSFDEIENNRYPYYTRGKVILSNITPQTQYLLIWVVETKYTKIYIRLNKSQIKPSRQL